MFSLVNVKKIGLNRSSFRGKPRNYLIGSGKNDLLFELIFFLSYFSIYDTVFLQAFFGPRLSPRTTGYLDRRVLDWPSLLYLLRCITFQFTSIHLGSSFKLSFLSRLGLGPYICLTALMYSHCSLHLTGRAFA